MPLTTATVEFVPLRNDLANLPHSLAGMLFTANIAAQNAVVELELQGKSRTLAGSAKNSVFLGWTGLSAAKNDTIEIDPTFGSNLGVAHGQKVKISVSAQTPLAHTIHLEPATSSDWEIMETHVAFLETYMINQVRAVRIGQPITVFPSATAIATLHVTKIEPPPPVVARLSPESEVIVAPKTAHRRDTAPETLNGEQSHSSAGQASALPGPVVAKASVHPYIDNLNKRALEIRGDLPAPYLSGQSVLVSLVVPPPLVAGSAPGKSSPDESEVPRAKSIYATYLRDDVSVLGMSYGLSNALGLAGDAGVGTKLLVRPAQHLKTTSINVTLRPYELNSTSTKSVSSAASSAVDADLLAKLQLPFVGKGLVVPPLGPELPDGGIIDTDSKEWGRPGHVTWGAPTPLAESKRMTPLLPLEDQSKQKPKERPVVGQDKLIDKLLTTLESGSGTLLYGSRGSGKSAIINDVMSRLRRKHIRPLNFKCGAYTDKALSTVRDALKKLSMEAQWLAPCVLVFDDLDKLIPADQEHNSDSMRRQQLAEVFKNTWEPLITAGQVSILAAAQDRAEVHSYLLTSHLLENIVHLKSPDKELREKILRVAIETSGLQTSSSLDLLEVIGETEGYQPGDLWVLVDRLSSMLALSQETGQYTGDRTEEDEEPLVTTDAILEAAADFTPASLRGVKLERPNINWNDVGGLVTAKRVVLETLEWPTKYAPVFANCPLRLRSGLLFYGYPGCGKTMLAGAIASQTGLNFISVKGPEILNKYIGASEQSVRDLFDRAQAAKPCVLFFDEFDSIAPKRGHDATGVTDRVVNQLLTQMDGAEGLDGVYVLAATSRPDMIDSALLRPGRLDKSLLCDMPNADDRHDILVRASQKLNLAPEVNLRAVADKLEGYSGADLQALIYNAYLSAVHKVLADRADAGETTSSSAEEVHAFQIGPGDISTAKNYVHSSPSGNKGHSSQDESRGNVERVTIGLLDIEKALADSKPSISPQEVARFRSIYSEFSTDRNGEMPPGTSSNEVGGRVTLQ